MASLKRLQAVLKDLEAPLVLFFWVRLGAGVCGSLVYRVLKHRLPRSLALCTRTVHALASAAVCTSAVALFFAGIVDEGALWAELRSCRPAAAPRPNALVALATLLMHVATTDLTPTLQTFFTVGALSRASPLGFLGATSCLAEFLDRPVLSATTTAVLAGFHLCGYRLAQHALDCGDAHTTAASSMASICLLQATRWMATSLRLLWREEGHTSQ